MSVVALPSDIVCERTAEAAQQLMKHLARQYKVWVSVACYGGHLWCRISSQVYNEKADYDRVAEAVMDIAGRQ